MKLERAKEGFPLTALRELTVLLELKHPNIVEVFEVVVSPKKQVPTPSPRTRSSLGPASRSSIASDTIGRSSPCHSSPCM